MPTKTQKKVVCWRSFASMQHSVARGQTFRADNEIPQRYAAHFVDAELPESERPVEEIPAPPERLSGRYRVRILPGAPEMRALPKATVGTRALYEGDVVELDARDAEALTDCGVGEIVESLPKRLAKTGRAIANGREVE